MLAVVPFLNQQQQNIFLNPAMAQEYDKYGDSSYSTYPTDDKKYECRTGPFEGFFVSSVEFCKRDLPIVNGGGDNGGNITIGPQGSQGPVGPVGATGATGSQGAMGLQGLPGLNGIQGPQGISGPNQISPTKYYIINGTPDDTPNLPLATASSTANCNPGDVIVSGGFNITSTDQPGFTGIRGIITEPLIGFNGWNTTITGPLFEITTKALCFDN